MIVCTDNNSITCQKINISFENKCIYIIFTTKTKLLNTLVSHNFTNLFIYKLIEHLTYVLQNNNIYIIIIIHILY